MRETELRKNNFYNCIGLTLSIVLSIIAVLIFLRVWEIDFNVPPELSGDEVLNVMIIKSISQNGLKGLYINDFLGAPEFAALADTPFFDLDMGIEIWLLSKLSLSPAAIFYLVYIISYPLSAAFMYLLLSRLSNNALLKTILSASFSVNPYHFFRVGHITLSQYQVVPVAIIIALIVAEEPFSTIKPTKYKKSIKQSVFFYAGCAWIGLSNIYYAFFAVICIFMGLLCKSIKKKSKSIIYEDAIPLYVVLAAIVIGLIPKFLYSLKYGENSIAGVRFPYESEMFGLKITQLLLPPAYSRVPFLAKITSYYNNNAINVNENMAASLGLIAGSGFVIICAYVILSLLPFEKKDTLFNSRMKFLSLDVLALVIYCTVGGVGALVSYFITPELRGLNRVSIVIACLSLCALALFIEYMLSAKLQHFYKFCNIFMMPCVVLLFAFSLYAELGYKPVRWQATAQKKDYCYQQFFSSIENELVEGASVYELPFVRFPEESPVFEMADYTQGLPYIYSDSIKWSYGAMKGRNTVAESLNIDEGSSTRFIEAVLTNGFSGVYINTDGFQDKGAEIIHFYSEEMDLIPIVSGDGKLYFYNIDSLRVDNYKLSPLYSFVTHYARASSHQLNTEDISVITSKMNESLLDMIDVLWEWAVSYDNLKGKMSNEAYVSWLYDSVLNRQESSEELESWCNVLASNSSRYDIFRSFILSEEFRDKYLRQ